MIVLLPFTLQGLVMMVDEFYCHRARELKRWERLGHPLDTLVFAACFGVLIFCEPSDGTLWTYLGLAASSCLLITKDEWQHQELCSGFENWLHSLLFILHPIILILAGQSWWSGEGGLEFKMMFGLTLGFFVYQTLYWNAWRRDRQRIL